MNKVELLGRFSRDPEVRYSQGENSIAIANFGIAVNRKYKSNGEQEADFISCKAFGKTAEFIEKYFHKGSKAAIVGRIQTGNYTNKDGQKVYTTDVIVEEIEFAESKNRGASENTAPATPSSQPNTDGFMNIPDTDDEELPFN